MVRTISMIAITEKYEPEFMESRFEESYSFRS